MATDLSVSTEKRTWVSNSDKVSAARGLLSDVFADLERRPRFDQSQAIFRDVILEALENLAKECDLFASKEFPR